MAKRRVIVSFDYEHDNYYYYLLKAWDNNPHFEFNFEDCTPKEIQSSSIGTIKRVLSGKIHLTTHMIAIVGKHSNDLHPDHDAIGYRNWQSFEIDTNRKYGNRLVVVKTESTNQTPAEALGIGAGWASSFTESSILGALRSLR